MRRREFLAAVLCACLVIFCGPGRTSAQSGWAGYCDLAIKAGAERCAIVGQNGTPWASVSSTKQPYSMTIRDVTTLIKDAKAKGSSSELHFDGTKFFYTSSVDSALIGKAGEYACAVEATRNTVLIVIAKGAPQAAQVSLVPLYTAMMKVGQ